MADWVKQKPITYKKKKTSSELKSMLVGNVLHHLPVLFYYRVVLDDQINAPTLILLVFVAQFVCRCPVDSFPVAIGTDSSYPVNSGQFRQSFFSRFSPTKESQYT